MFQVLHPDTMETLTERKGVLVWDKIHNVMRFISRMGGAYVLPEKFTINGELLSKEKHEKKVIQMPEGTKLLCLQTNEVEEIF